jgi:hypothetical protein
MWILRDNQDGTWMACHYTTELVKGKISRKIKSQVEGSKREALDFMLSFREDVPLSELKLACDMLEETGDDTAQFGVLGGFIMTKNELQTASC